MNTPFWIAAPFLDFLKANSLVQSNCSDWKFCAEICGKNYIKTWETRNYFSKLWQIHEITAKFPVLRSLFENLRRFSNSLRNHVIAWLQLLETLPIPSVGNPGFHWAPTRTDWLVAERPMLRGLVTLAREIDKHLNNYTNFRFIKQH